MLPGKRRGTRKRKSDLTTWKGKEATQVKSGTDRTEVRKSNRGKETPKRRRKHLKPQKRSSQEKLDWGSIKTGFTPKPNRKRRQKQEPDERGSLTGRNQVSSRNNAARHEFRRYGREMSEPRNDSHEWLRGCFLGYNRSQQVSNIRDHLTYDHILSL